ncbi:hypothetical protein GO986_17785 [Deinococcus sp. HMF7620]|uniref:Uncharacterized protein n=1 Tax=Deinococcus arboris TaxID=2682977 RepID=A0A7C9I0T6_9DEIO|nr:hypothetical protein [Deinococcus arboris]MVN88590.1 hypothetical protein [Deinococcus arboris]
MTLPFPRFPSLLLALGLRRPAREAGVRLAERALPDAVPSPLSALTAELRETQAALSAPDTTLAQAALLFDDLMHLKAERLALIEGRDLAPFTPLPPLPMTPARELVEDRR